MEKLHAVSIAVKFFSVKKSLISICCGEIFLGLLEMGTLIAKCLSNLKKHCRRIRELSQQ